MKIMLPVIRKTDILLVGGTVHACNLALKLRRQGLSVFAITPFSYFADDICARLDLHTPREGEERELFWAEQQVWEMLTPMVLKHRVDRRFADAGIDYMFQTHPVRLVRSKDGQIAGLAVANRSGLQIIAAKVIIDATGRELVARLAGAPCADFVPGDYPVSLRAIGEAPQAGAGITVAAAEEDVREGARTYPQYQVTMPVHFNGNSPLDLAAADVMLRRAAWTPGTLMLADVCDVDLHDGVSDAYTPSPACPVVLASRADADTVAELCARCSEAMPAVVDSGDIADRTYDLVRKDDFFRFKEFPNIEFDLNCLPETAAVDVLVAGGGTGGAPAAIAAARAGAKTLCVENLSQLGGIATAGVIGCYYFGNRIGFTTEMDNGTTAMGGGRETYKSDDACKNIRWKAAWLLQEATKAGACVLFNSLLVAAAVSAKNDANGRKAVCGAVVATPAGLAVIAAKKTVDATGNADLAAAAGGDTAPLIADEPVVQGAGLSPIRLGGDYLNTDFNFICDCDVLDATRAYTMARGKYTTQFDSSQILNTRERRRIIGDLTLQPQDFFANRMYDDTVNIAYSNFDTHGYIIHPMFMLKPPAHEPHYAKVPYRAMLPRNLDGVIVTGLAMSAHRDCMPLIRMQPDVQNQGFAAGAAAAMTAEAGLPMRNIDMKKLQRFLIEHAILPETILDEHDRIGEIAQGDIHYELANIFLAPEKSRAELHTQFLTEKDLHRAHILAFLGDDCGKEVLAEAIAAMDWDKGWNYTGMGQFGMSMSPLDSMLFALAHIGGDKEVILGKLQTLRYEHEFSHIRAICMALVHHPDARAAEKLTSLLRTYGATGHAVRRLRDVFTANREEWNDTECRNFQLKELYLAKALAACDPHNGEAQTVLDAYKNSLNGYYALFAGK